MSVEPVFTYLDLTPSQSELLADVAFGFADIPEHPMDKRKFWEDINVLLERGLVWNTGTRGAPKFSMDLYNHIMFCKACADWYDEHPEA